MDNSLSLAVQGRVQQGSNSIPLPSIWRVTETKARVASQNINYTGAVRMVGVGQTYTTLTAAAAAAADLDILQIASGNTINLASESGGYWLVNSNTKRLLVRGDANDNTAVVINHSTATYGIRMRDCNSVTFENITFTSNQNAGNGIIAMEVYANNNFLKCKNCVFTSTNIGSSSYFLKRASTITSTTAVYIEFDHCVINNSGSSAPINYSALGLNEILLINDCVINSSGRGVNFSSGNHGKIAIYDSDIVMNSTSNGVQFGEDTAAPTYTDFVVDFRNNNVSYVGSNYGHAVLFGRGTNSVYCVNNTITTPSIDNVSSYSFVIKTIGASIGNGVYSNYPNANAAVGIYLDANTSTMTVDSNSVANCCLQSILLNNANSGTTIRDNTLINGVGIPLYFANTGNSYTVRKNILYSSSASFPVFCVFNINSTTSDSNYLLRPISESLKMRTDYSNYMTLANWRIGLGWDINSQETPTSITSDLPLIYYNPTLSDSTIALNGIYKDAKGYSYYNTITIKPFQSAILFKTVYGVSGRIGQLFFN